MPKTKTAAALTAAFMAAKIFAGPAFGQEPTNHSANSIAAQKQLLAIWLGERLDKWEKKWLDRALDPRFTPADDELTCFIVFFDLPGGDNSKATIRVGSDRWQMPIGLMWSFPEIARATHRNCDPGADSQPSDPVKVAVMRRRIRNDFPVMKQEMLKALEKAKNVPDVAEEIAHDSGGEGTVYETVARPDMAVTAASGASTEPQPRPR